MSKGVTPQVPKLPPAIKRASRWGYFSFAGIVISPLILFWPGAMSSISASGMWSALIIPAVTVGPLFVGTEIQRRAMARIRRAVATSKGRSCMRCVYDLRGLGDSGACPECGHSFCIDQDRKAWTMAGCGYNEAMYTDGGTTLAPLPPAIRRTLWWFAVPTVCTVAGLAALLSSNLGGADSLPSIMQMMLYSLPILASVVLAIGTIARNQRRVVRAVQTTGGRSCVKCMHDLRGLGDTGTCPTCKRPFNTVADQCSWARVLPPTQSSPGPPIEPPPS